MGDKLVAAILTALDEQTVTVPRGNRTAATGGQPANPLQQRSSITGEHPAHTDNRKLKRAFFLAAFAASSGPTSRTYHDRKRAEGRKYDAALICVARRRRDVEHGHVTARSRTLNGL